MSGKISETFFAKVLEIARATDLMSDEHFTVDGTLLEAWASHKSFKPKGEVLRRLRGAILTSISKVKGKARKNETHE